MSKRTKKNDDLLREQETPMVLGHELVRHSLTPRIVPVSRAQAALPEVKPARTTAASLIDPAPHSPIFRDLLALSSR